MPCESSASHAAVRLGGDALQSSMPALLIWLNTWCFAQRMTLVAHRLPVGLFADEAFRLQL
jgi:hypothetical protein